MAYIGKEPVYGNLVKQTLTPNGVTTSFTLNYTVSTAASLIVSVGGVIQSPDVAYTIGAGGGSIVFDEAPASGLDVFVIFLGVQGIINTPADNTVTTSRIVDNAVTSVKMSTTGVTSGTYGNATLIPRITVDGAGRITSASNVALAVDVNNINGSVRITGNIRPDIYLETMANIAVVSGNITLNLANATVFRAVVTSAANIVLQNPPPANVGYSALIQLFQTGSYAITWPTSIQWPANTAPTLSTTNGYVDTIAIYTVDGGVNYYGTSVLGQF